MNKKNKEFEISMLYIGCVIGAGFASGQETLQFFSKYGRISNLSICLMGFLFGFIAWLILRICDIKGIEQYGEFQNLMGGKVINKVFSVSAYMFMFICLSTMFAGCGALIQEGFGIKAIFGGIIFAILCYAVLMKGAYGIIKVNKILTILLIINTVVICTYILLVNIKMVDVLAIKSTLNSVETFATTKAYNNDIFSILSKIRNNWVVALLLYVSYNLITSRILLVTNSREVRNKHGRLVIAVSSGLVFILIGLLQNKIILDRIGVLSQVEIPILAVVKSLNNIVSYTYIITILLAMFTTAISMGWGLIINIEKNQRKRALIIIIAAVCFSQIGFSSLVAKIYPLFGYVGLIEIILIFIYSWRRAQKND